MALPQMLEPKRPSLTKFEYRYRDACNFKVYGRLLLEGNFSVSEREEIVDRLEAEEFFIAEQLEIPPLYVALYELSGGPTKADHCWHEYVGLGDYVALEDYQPVWGTTAKLLSKFRSVHEWNERLSPHVGIF